VGIEKITKESMFARGVMIEGLESDERERAVILPLGKDEHLSLR